MIRQAIALALARTRLILCVRAEAQGAWWFSRASNPLRVVERRPGWVRFPHASASFYFGKVKQMLRSIPGLVSLLFVLMISSHCLGQTSPPPPSVRVGGVVEEINPAAWKKFTSEEGRFVVSFPGKPKAQSQTINTSAGKFKSKTHILKSNIASYMVSYFDLPLASDDPATSKVLLDGGRDTALANMKGKLKSEKEITLEGYPGRHTVAEIDGGVINARTYVVKNRIYQVMVVTPVFEDMSAEGVELFNSFVDKFLDSFELAKEKM